MPGAKGVGRSFCPTGGCSFGVLPPHSYASETAPSSAGWNTGLDARPQLGPAEAGAEPIPALPEALRSRPYTPSSSGVGHARHPVYERWTICMGGGWARVLARLRLRFLSITGGGRGRENPSDRGCIAKWVTERREPDPKPIPAAREPFGCIEWGRRWGRGDEDRRSGGGSSSGPARTHQSEALTKPIPSIPKAFPGAASGWHGKRRRRGRAGRGRVEGASWRWLWCPGRTTHLAAVAIQ